MGGAVIDAAPDAIITLDETGVVIEWNPAAERIFGFPRSEAVGSPLAELIVPPRYRAEHRAGIQRFMRTGQGALIGRRIEITAVKKDGSEIPVEIAIELISVNDRPAFTGFVRDISDRRKAEEALQEANRELETLLRVVGHDLMAPLRSVSNFSGMLRKNLRDRANPKEQDAFDRIEKATERMSKLIDDILRLAKTRTIEAPVDIIDGGDIVRDALERLAGMIEEKNARVSVTDSLPSLPVDRFWMTEAIYNLTANALKYTRENLPPEIVIDRYENAGDIGFAVRDRGPGVSDQMKEKIFKLFERGDITTPEGTGAGLAIVTEVARRHGGRAFVQGREGGGSEFVIAFPLTSES